MYNEDFQASIKRTVPSGHCFKGFPTCFNHLDVIRMAAALLEPSNVAAVDLVSSRGDHVRLAVRVKVVVYPEDMVAVWVMLAARYQPLVAN